MGRMAICSISFRTSGRRTSRGRALYQRSHAGHTWEWLWLGISLRNR